MCANILRQVQKCLEFEGQQLKHCNRDIFTDTLYIKMLLSCETLKLAILFGLIFGYSFS